MTFLPKTYKNWATLPQAHKDKARNLYRKKGQDINEKGEVVNYIIQSQSTTYRIKVIALLKFLKIEEKEIKKSVLGSVEIDSNYPSEILVKIWKKSQ